MAKKKLKTALYTCLVGQFHGHWHGVRYDVKPGKRTEVSPGVYELPKAAGDHWVKTGHLAPHVLKKTEAEGTSE